jgi:hypothetical protein
MMKMKLIEPMVFLDFTRGGTFRPDTASTMLIAKNVDVI